MDGAAVQRLFTYDRWANRQVAQALATSAAPPPNSIKWFAHILGAEALWLARLKRQPAPQPVWPDISSTDLLSQLDLVNDAWQEFLDGLGDAALGSNCAYVNSRGEPFVNSVRDVLTHVVMHSTYHRGQIAADMRAAGLEPVYTDFIHAARQGYIGSAAGVEAPDVDPDRLRYVILFKPGPNWVPGKSVFDQPLRAHVEYMQELCDKGKLLYAGPFLGDGGGLAVLRMSSDAEARQILAEEPATLEQFFVAEAHPWHVTFNATQDRALLRGK
jgi:uncharacterized damage-inducible protein DinB/uncharacterized protein YciI